MYKSGTLHIKPICAKLEHNTETFGNMDPYCKISIAHQTLKTAPAKDHGMNPSWDEKLTFTLNQDSDQIHISIFDKDKWSSDDYICDAWVPLADAHLKGSHSEWFDLHRKGKLVGKINLYLEYIPS